MKRDVAQPKYNKLHHPPSNAFSTTLEEAFLHSMKRTAIFNAPCSVKKSTLRSLNHTRAIRYSRNIQILAVESARGKTDGDKHASR